MKRIALIGYSDTLHYLYLPILQRIETPVQWYLHEESPMFLNQMIQAVAEHVVCETVDDLFAHELDGAIIARQTADYRRIKFTLIKQGIPVFTIPPLEQDMIQLERDLNAAERFNGFVMPSYVNRYSEMMNVLRDIPEKKHLSLTQRFINSRRLVEEAVWGDFSEMLHTAFYIINEPIEKGSFRIRKNGMYLEELTVYLESQSMSALLRLNEQSGTQYHEAVVESLGGMHTLNNWQTLTIRQGSEVIVVDKDPWESMPHRYGIELAIQTFIEHLDTPTQWPISKENMLETYQISNRITSALSTEGYLTFKHTM
ncbi:hypothetical protein [Atopobacter phocae]|uniref:hypothetical protein n=1 Tax=Atopobacter phocae TaxID=136492 RepID=UPI0004723454|nr:hypothetical protein [Atopobacter phocae]